MKFKRLPIKELEKLEKEFIQFLVYNGITVEDWAKQKIEAKELSEGLINLFSDIVYQKTLEKIKYLEFRTPKDIKCFCFENDKIILIGLAADQSMAIDLRNPTEIAKLNLPKKALDSKLSIYTASKPYNTSREKEIFTMMENGAEKTDGFLFNTLQNLHFHKDN